MRLSSTFLNPILGSKHLLARELELEDVKDLLVVCEPLDVKTITYAIPRNVPSFYIEELRRFGIKAYEIELGKTEKYNLIETSISIELFGKQYNVLLGLRDDSIKFIKLMELLKEDFNINVGIVIFLYGISYGEIDTIIKILRLQDLVEHVEILRCDKLQLGIISLRPTDHIIAFYNLIILPNIITNLLSKDLLGIEIHFSAWKDNKNIFIDKERGTYSEIFNKFLISLFDNLSKSFNNLFITNRLEDVIRNYIQELNAHKFNKIEMSLCDAIESLYIDKIILIDIPVLINEINRIYVDYATRISIGIYMPQVSNPSSTAISVYKLLITSLWSVITHES